MQESRGPGTLGGLEDASVQDEALDAAALAEPKEIWSSKGEAETWAVVSASGTRSRRLIKVVEGRCSSLDGSSLPS